MTTQFTITVGRHVATAELFMEAAPATCAAFIEQLPLDTFTVHAKFAGDELIAMVPFFENLENKATSVDPGDIGYYPNRQTLCLFYGEILPFGTVSSFARVVSGLDAMRLAAQEVKEMGSLSTRIELVRQDGADGTAQNGTGGTWTNDAAPVSAGVNGSSGGDAALSLNAIDAFLRASWFDEPSDVTKLRALSRPPLGNLPCVLYANFDLFWLGENLLVCRERVLSGEWAAGQASTTIATLAEVTAERLGKWGFPDTVAFLEGAVESLSSRPDADATALLAFLDGLLLAVNRVQTWVDVAIPWAGLDAAIALNPTPSTRVPAAGGQATA